MGPKKWVSSTSTVAEGRGLPGKPEEAPSGGVGPWAPPTPTAHSSSGPLGNSVETPPQGRKQPDQLGRRPGSNYRRQGVRGDRPLRWEEVALRALSNTQGLSPPPYDSPHWERTGGDMHPAPGEVALTGQGTLAPGCGSHRPRLRWPASAPWS